MSPDQERELGLFLFRQATDACFLLGADLRILEANASAEKLTGLSQEQLRSRRLQELLGEVSPGGLAALEAACRLGEGQASLDGFLLRSRTGEGRHVLLSASRIEGAPQPCLLVLMRDITPIKQIESSLRESEERYRRLTELAGVIPWEAAPDQERLVFVGAQAVPLLGYPIESWYRPRFWEEHLHPDDRPVIQECRERASAQQSFELEFRMLAADGRVVWLHDLVESVGERDGVRTLRGVMIDITARRKAEQERQLLLRAAEQTQKLESLDMLAAGVAHEFNNLLTVILGNTGLLIRELPADSPYQVALQQVEAASLRGAELTQQLRVYTGKDRQQIERVDVGQVARETALLLKPILAGSAEIQTELDESLPFVRADDTHLRQVLINLLTNAREALEARAGKILVRTSLAQPHTTPPAPAPGCFFWTSASLPDAPTQPAGRQYVCLEVSDTGHGMEPDQVPRIFEPFYTTRFLGRGLGLSAVLGIVRAHEGVIEVTSGREQGALFRVFFPTYPEDQDQPRREAASREGAASSTVLVIDDEAMIRTLISKVLATGGFKVLSAADGPSGLELLHAHAGEIAAVVLDLTMPGMSGEQVLEQMRATNKDVPVVLISGYSDEEPSEPMTRHQVAGFLSKPFQPDVLVQLLRKVIEPTRG